MFIELTTPLDGKPITFNIHHITTFYPADAASDEDLDAGARTRIWWGEMEDSYTDVLEDYGHVKNLVQTQLDRVRSPYDGV